MPEQDSHAERVKKLLAQDSEIKGAQTREFRVQLEQSLESWEEKTKRARRRVYIALAVYLGVMSLFWSYAVIWRHAPDALSHRAPEHAEGPPKSGAAPWLIYVPVILAAAITNVWLIALYLLRYLPRLSRARFDLHTAMMLELQQQVKQLHEEYLRRDK
jgi:hypothetical protein